jgi:hypothetical protein
MKKIAEFFHRIFEILSRHLPESELSELKSEFEEIREQERNGYRNRVARHRLKKCNGYENGNGYGNRYISKTCENGSKTQISAENSAISAPKGGRGGFLNTTSTSNPNGTVNSTNSTKEKNKIKKEKCNGYGNGYSEEMEKNFEIFWQAWPRSDRKANRDGTKRKLLWALRNNKGLTFEKIMEALEWWKNRWSDPQYIPAPTVWLNNRRWEAMDNAPSNKPSEPPRTAYIAPPAEEKHGTISLAEFAAILKGGSNGPRNAMQ